MQDSPSPTRAVDNCWETSSIMSFGRDRQDEARAKSPSLPSLGKSDLFRDCNELNPHNDSAGTDRNKISCFATPRKSELEEDLPLVMTQKKSQPKERTFECMKIIDYDSGRRAAEDSRVRPLVFDESLLPSCESFQNYWEKDSRTSKILSMLKEDSFTKARAAHTLATAANYNLRVSDDSWLGGRGKLSPPQEVIIDPKTGYDVRFPSKNRRIFPIHLFLPTDKTSSANAKRQTSSCTCQKSMCLRLYCSCFLKGELCGPECSCKDCLNNEQYSEIRDLLVEGLQPKLPYKLIKTSTESENQHIQIAETTRCICKKTGCLKKYCACFKSNRRCGHECKCAGCMNCGRADDASQVASKDEKIVKLPKKRTGSTLNFTDAYRVYQMINSNKPV